MHLKKSISKKRSKKRRQATFSQSPFSQLKCWILAEKWGLSPFFIFFFCGDYPILSKDCSLVAEWRLTHIFRTWDVPRGIFPFFGSVIKE
jgi:hypothetical protein